MSGRLVNLSDKLRDVCPGERKGWFATTVVVPVRGVDPSTAVQRVAAARQAMEADTEHAPFNLHIEARHHQGGHRNGTDKKPWRPEISHHHHSTMGYYRYGPPAPGMPMPNKGRVYDGNRNAVVVSMAESSIVDAAINAVIAEHPEMTVGELINTPEYRLAPVYMEQNCLRIAAQLGAALTEDAASAVMNIESDIFAASVDSWAPPVYAVASHVAVSNYFETKNMPPLVAGEKTAGKTIFHDNSVDTLFTPAAVQAVDARTGFVIKGPVPSAVAAAATASIGAPMTASVMRASPSENISAAEFVANQTRDGARAFIAKRFVTPTGNAPSRVDKAFYSRDGLPNAAQPGDVRLEPVGVSVNAKDSVKSKQAQ